MLQGEHSAILSNFIKLPLVIKILFCLFLSGRFTKVLLYLRKSKSYLVKECIAFFKLTNARIVSGHLNMLLTQLNLVKSMLNVFFNDLSFHVLSTC